MLIVFDLMDTLIADPYREAHEAACGMTFAEFERRRPDGVYHSLERGEIREADYWRSLRDWDIDIDPEVFHRTRRAGYRWLDGMRELVDECMGQRPTIVGSNYPVWIEEVREKMLADTGLETFASYQCGIRKPAGEFFAALCRRTGTALEELLLVDDKADNVQAVVEIGGRGVLFGSAATAAAKLRECGALR